MKRSTRGFALLAFMLFTVVALSAGGPLPGRGALATVPAPGDDLCVVRRADPGLDAIAALPGVRVYARLEGGALVGLDAGGAAAIRAADPSAQIVPVEPRRADCDYFVFRVASADRARLRPGVALVYTDGEETIARVEAAAGLPEVVGRLTRGLTRISFVPRPVRTRRPSMALRRPERGTAVQAIVDQVSQAEYTAWIQRLQDFVTRYAYTDSCRAAEQWAADSFASMGLESELFPFDYGGRTWNDVIGRKVGTVYPDSVYMIIGHMDSISDNPDVEAPGAEDNGSGSACVLEAARVMSAYDFDCTIEFVLMTGEEQGLIGSEAYASYNLGVGRRIGGVFNYDMISYAGSWGWDTNIYADRTFPQEVALADLLGQLTTQYSVAVPVRVGSDGPAYGSDHYYFSLYGFPAPFSIDAQLWGAPDFYPWYHTTNDRISNLDLDFGTEVVRGAVATLSTVAGLSLPPDVTISIVPDNPPVEVPPGGAFTFTGSLTNHGATTATVDAWVVVDAPGYGHYGPVLRFDDIRIGAGQTLTRPGITQTIPPGAPAGTFTYLGYAGYYPSSPADSSWFDFVVTGGAPRRGSRE